MVKPSNQEDSMVGSKHAYLLDYLLCITKYSKLRSAYREFQSAGPGKADEEVCQRYRKYQLLTGLALP